MTSEERSADAEAPGPKAGRAGRDLPAAIAVGVSLVLLAAASLVLYKPSFVAVVVVAMGVGVNELNKALGTAGVAMPAVPVQLGSVAMLLAAYLEGPDAMVVTVALTVLPPATTFCGLACLSAT